MSQSFVSIWACLVALLLVLVGALPAQAHDGDEIAKLWKQIVALQQAGKEREVLPLAQRSLALAERSYADQPSILGSCMELVACAYENRDEVATAEARFKQLLAYREKSLGRDHVDVARTLRDLGRIAEAQGRLAEAESLVRRALAINEKQPGKESEDYGNGLNLLAGFVKHQGRFADAELYYLQALAIREKIYGAESVDVAKLLHNYSTMLSDQGRYADAEKFARRALANFEKNLSPDHPILANTLNSLGLLAERRGDFVEAERLLRRAMELREKSDGAESSAYATSLNNLANVFLQSNRYPEAKDYYERSLTLYERIYGPKHPKVAEALNNFGSFHHSMARLAEAEQLHRRSLAIREAVYGPHHEDVAQAVHNLGVCAKEQGRLADAEALYKRALAIREKVLGLDHTELALTMSNLGTTYQAQGRNEEAEPLLLRALEIRRKALGDESPAVADSWEVLRSFYLDDGRIDEAEALARKVLAIRQKTLGADNVVTVQAVAHLGTVFVQQKRYAEAQESFQKSVDAVKRVYGPDHPQVAFGLNRLAELHFLQDQFADAEPLLDRAIQILERAQAHPDVQFWQYDTRAKIAWRGGLKSEAIADLHRAMDLAEQIRGQTSGAAHERATGFAQYARAFERMLEWQVEVGDTTEALAAIERGRARGLLDDMNASGVDLQAGRPPAERAQLQEHELQIKSRIAQFEQQCDKAPVPKRADLERQLADVRAELYKFYRDTRSTSPVYRTLLSVGATPLRLRQLQRSLADNGGLMLIYFLGEDSGYLLAIRGESAKLHKLELAAEQAKLLGVDAGPLTQKLVEQMLSGEDKRPGVVAKLADSRKTAPPLAELHALWQTLVPDAEREQLISGKFQRLIVIPDGALALLPFETLVVEQGAQPKYLLDVGPPTMYAPSATVLFNLASAQKDTTRKAKQPVLTVADPAYPRAAPTKQVASAGPNSTTLASLSAGSRFARSGGELARLPYSGQEAKWLVQGFEKHGQTALMLAGTQATEAAVRQQLTGHAIVHMACHGLTDQRYGNFFGALAFTPGKANDPADDGFLTLPEIYELDLKDCELAILSACQTNYGPQQQGEGVWTLSRGFLVAGARRVVASNWLVDDEATASLISYYAGGLANDREKNKAVDYAAALHAAKRWVRQQGKWSSPYYWGTFELIGPQ